MSMCNLKLQVSYIAHRLYGHAVYIYICMYVCKEKEISLIKLTLNRRVFIFYSFIQLPNIRLLYNYIIIIS